MNFLRRFLIVIGLLFLTPVVWAQTLGTTNLVEGCSTGSDSVVLAANGAWTATPNDAWLHLSVPNQSGTGSANVIFTFDANPGPTRMGTLTIAGQTLTVTQAGATYVSTTNLTTLVSTGFSPYGVAVDGLGNVYVAEAFGYIKKWVAASNTNITLVSIRLWLPRSVAVDSTDNVYIADTGNNAIKQWVAASNTVITLVSSGLSSPSGVAVDGAGNVYIADTLNNAIKEWVAASNTVITLVSSGLASPRSVAVDSAGDLYIADTSNNAIKKWVAASNAVITLVSSGLSSPFGVAVDGAGNVYIADTSNNAIKEWVAASNTVITLVSSGLSTPSGVAVDGSGNVYIASTSSNVIKQLPHTFVDSAPKVETAAAGSDVLSAVLPATANLTGLNAPVSDSAWLTITGVTNGVVSFAFTTNNFVNRTGRINLLGQTITVTQMGPPNYITLGTTNLLEGPGAGSDSVVLAANGAWTATPNDAWLHLSAENQSGSGSTNVIFTYDANPGVTRTGTLTLAGLTLTVTQAGAPYVAITKTTTLVATGYPPRGVAVDGMGNVYVADSGNKIKKWVAASNTVITLVSSGLVQPSGVAVDDAGNVYIADAGNYAIKKWVAASNIVISLVSTGLSSPYGVAVDSLGNVYIADYGHNAIKKWDAANNTVSTLVSSGLSHPSGVAVDAAGNVYIADSWNQAIKKWMVASGTVANVVSSGLSLVPPSNFDPPSGLTVDGAGDVFIFSAGDKTIKKWQAASNTLTTLPSEYGSQCVGVDIAGNAYIASWFGTISELPHAFVDATTKVEPAVACSDALPVVVPATASLTGTFAPASDAAWLTITGVSNGVVNFAFTANPAATNRTAQISLLGQKIAVTQAGGNWPVLTGFAMLGNGAFQFGFSNQPGRLLFTVWSSTNLALPLTNWTVLGTLTNDGSDQFQFTDPTATNDVQRYYRVSSP